MEHKVIIGEDRVEELTYGEKPHSWSENKWYIGDTGFDGHMVLWGFSYKPSNYLKTSGLSGNEYRKGGEIKIFRNRECVYSEFCRDTNIAFMKLGGMISQLRGFDELNGFSFLRVGQRVRYKGQLGTIKYVMLDQGCISILLDGMTQTIKIEYYSDWLSWFDTDVNPYNEIKGDNQ